MSEFISNYSNEDEWTVEALTDRSSYYNNTMVSVHIMQLTFFGASMPMTSTIIYYTDTILVACMTYTLKKK